MLSEGWNFFSFQEMPANPVFLKTTQNKRNKKRTHKAKNNQPTNLPPAKLLRYMEAFFHLITTSLGLLLFKLLLLSVLPTGE